MKLEQKTEGLYSRMKRAGAAMLILPAVLSGAACSDGKTAYKDGNAQMTVSPDGSRLEIDTTEGGWWYTNDRRFVLKGPAADSYLAIDPAKMTLVEYEFDPTRLPGDSVVYTPTMNIVDKAALSENEARAREVASGLLKRGLSYLKR